MDRSEYLANLAMAQAAGAQVLTRRKAPAHHQKRPARKTRVNGWPLLGFFLAFLWVFLLPLVAYVKG
ncbi:hypothetical protein [Aquabacterium sp.]|uniref:hypothetical protein n=1 Tax=Aquabacterium sp. TaxID=1872578 RepID=UPI004037E970